MKKIYPLHLLIAVAIVALIATNGLTVWMLLHRSAAQTLHPIVLTNSNQTDTSTTTTTASTTPDVSVDTTVPVAKTMVSVTWNDIVAEVSPYNLFDYTTVNEKLARNQSFKDRGVSVDEFLKGIGVYRVGTVHDGTYAGDDVYVVSYYPEGPAFRRTFYRVIKTDSGLVHIAAQSDPLSDEFTSLMTSDRETGLSGLETPREIAIPNSTIQLKRVTQEPFKLITQYEKLTKLFKYNDTDFVYKDEIDNCFVIRAADGSAREYYFDESAFGAATIDETFGAAKPTKLDITFNDGSKNQTEYNFQAVGGCGARGCYDYASYITSVNQLRAVGTLANGSVVYELADVNTKVKPTEDKSILQSMYEISDSEYTNSEVKPKESFDAFLTKRPILYWQDPFGKFIAFHNASFVSLAECGKPVIYLYPEKTEDVSVLVKPAGGFTVTDPAYNNGWFVRATPQSELFNYADDKVYSYLFWEGFGYNYQQPKEGFVVSRAEVPSFLTRTLAQLGLNKKESAAFMEFWVPKMKEKPYYFVTFLPQAQFDMVAPLTVSPKPDTVIRVFMNYQGLDQNITVPTPHLVTPIRHGFTVVEWGGVLHH